MSKEQDNKAIVGRWFTEFWGNPWNPDVVDELAAPDMLLRYSLHAPRRGRGRCKAFMKDFRAAFPDLDFWGAADLIAEGDYVVGRWEGGGTHTGPAFSDFLIGSLPAASGRRMRFTGTTVLRVENGRIAEEIGLDDGATALQQLGILRAADCNRRRGDRHELSHHRPAGRTVRPAVRPAGRAAEGTRCGAAHRRRRLSLSHQSHRRRTGRRVDPGEP